MLFQTASPGRTDRSAALTRAARPLRLCGGAALLIGLAAPAWAALDLKIQANPGPAMPGESVLMTFVVTNSSGFTRSGVVMKMPFPAGLNALSHSLIESGSCDGSVSGNNHCEATELVIWNLGSLAAGRSVTVTMPPTVAAATLPGAAIAFQAEVGDSSGSKATANEQISVVNDRVLQLSLSKLAQEPVQAGNALSYQLSFGHTASAATAANAVLEFTLPEGTSFVAASDNGILVGNKVQWLLGNLLPGQIGERRVRLSLNSNAAAGTVKETEATLTADGGKWARADVLTRVEEAPGLALALDVNASPARPGETLDGKLTISNTGFFDRAGVRIQLRYPAGLAPLSHGLIDTGSCDGSVSGNNHCEPTERLIWNLGTLAAGQSKTLNLTPQVATTTLPGSVIEFAARAQDNAGAVTGASEVVQISPSRVLQLGLTETSPAPVQAGAKLGYQLSFGHTANSAAALNAQLSLRLPVGSSFVSASDGGVLLDGQVQWALGTLSPGQVGERRVELIVDGTLGAGSLLKTEAALRADGGKLALSDTLTRVDEPQGLRLAIDANVSPAIPGETLDTKLTLSNTSFFDRSDVRLQMRYPVGLAPLGHGLIEHGSCDGTVSGNNHCEATERLVWNLGTIAAGQSRTVTLPPKVDMATLPGSVIEFSAWASDGSGAAVSAFEALQIVNSRVLQLGVSEVGQEPVPPGTPISYQLTFGHTASAATASAAVMELPVPAGMQFVSASDGGLLNNGMVRWNLGNLVPGQVGQRQVVLLPEPLSSQETGSLYKVEAWLRDASGKLVRADDTTRVEAERPLGLSLNLASNPSQPGDAVQVEITFTNHSDFDRSGVLLSTRYPEGLVPLPHSALSGGSCDGSVSGNNHCEGLERANWDLGTVPARASVTKTFSPTVLSSALKGRLIEFTAWVEDAGNGARATRLLRIGKEVAAIVDTDGDGIPDEQDNCKLVANANQRDTDADGYGNICDADLDNNGVVNTLDLAKFKTFLGSTGAGLAADLDGNGVVNTLDLAILKRLFGKPPGPSGTAP